MLSVNNIFPFTFKRNFFDSLSFRGGKSEGHADIDTNRNIRQCRAFVIERNSSFCLCLINSNTNTLDCL